MVFGSRLPKFRSPLAPCLTWTAFDIIVIRMSKQTMSKREFLRHPPAGSSLKHGETLVVTDRGVPAFQVSRVGRRGKSGEDYRQEALRLWPRKARKVDTVALLRGDER